MHISLSKRTVAILGGVLLTGAVQAQVWWPQWAVNPQHAGEVSIAGQPLNNILANTVYDPLVPEEMAANGGELLAHYQVPLIDSSNIYMEFKSGRYNKNTYWTEAWGENAFQWQNGQFVPIWSFTSDWAAPGSQGDFWEPVFHGVLANGFVYVPGAGGTLFKLNTRTGAVVSRINPFGTGIDPRIIVAGVPSTDGKGNIYYNAIQQFNPGVGISFYQHDIVDSWLVKVTFDDSTAKVSYSVLVGKTAPGSLPSPLSNDQCLTIFSTKDLPWPPSPTAVPPTAPCETMRPALNAAPAVAPDGTIYTVTRTNLLGFYNRYGGIAAVNPDLTPKWWTSLRDRLNDACNNDQGTIPGALLPANGTPGGSRYEPARVLRVASPQSVQRLDVLPLGGLVHRRSVGARISHLATSGGDPDRPNRALVVRVLRDNADPALAGTATPEEAAAKYPAQPRLSTHPHARPA